MTASATGMPGRISGFIRRNFEQLIITPEVVNEQVEARIKICYSAVNHRGDAPLVIRSGKEEENEQQEKSEPDAPGIDRNDGRHGCRDCH
jgi:hypothetical protein